MYPNNANVAWCNDSNNNNNNSYSINNDKFLVSMLNNVSNAKIKCGGFTIINIHYVVCHATAYSLFQNKFSREGDLVLPLSSSSGFFFYLFLNVINYLLTSSSSSSRPFNISFNNVQIKFCLSFWN